MPIKTDRSDLPPGRQREGMIPTQGSDFAEEIAAGFVAHMDIYRKRAFGLDEDQDGSERPMSRPGALFRHSDATGCARQLSYKLQRLPASDPPTVPDLMNMFWGTIIHEHADHALRAMGWPPEDVETPTGWDVVMVGDGPERKPLFVPMGNARTPLDDRDGRRPFSAGTLDGRHTYEIPEPDEAPTPWLRVVETKSQADYSYRLHAGLLRNGSVAEGPAWSAINQGALGAAAEGADELVVLDVAKAVISKPDQAKLGIDELERIVAPYHFDRDTRIPVPTSSTSPPMAATFPQIAERQLRWVHRITELVAAGTPVPRMVDDPEIPTDARIIEPAGPKNRGVWQVRSKTGQVTGAGEYWGCGYCWHRTRCLEELQAEREAAAVAS